MPFGRQVLFWITALVVTGVLLWLFAGILLPFVFGAFIAYLLNPIARRLQRLGLSRSLAATLILLVVVVLVAFILLLVVPAVVNQMLGFIQRLPGYAIALQAFVNTHWEGARVARFLGMDLVQLQDATRGLLLRAAGWLATTAQLLLTRGTALFSTLALVFVTPVIAFYLLLDWDRMVTTVDGWLPRKHAPTIRRLMRQMDIAVGGFVHGQLAVASLLGCVYAVALLAIGLDHALLIGLATGFLGFIPYLGTITGFVISTGVALNQYWPDFLWIGIVILVFVVGQFVEGNILHPKLVGDRVGLHPVWLMFALLAFGSLFGFVGLLIGVPAAAALGVLVRFGMEQYRQSELYRGGPELPAPADDVYPPTGDRIEPAPSSRYRTIEHEPTAPGE